MKNFSLQKTLTDIVAVISLVCVALVFVFNFLFTATVSYDAYENVTIKQTVLTGAILLLVIFAVLYLSTFIKNRKSKFNAKKLFFICTAVYAVAGMYLLINVDNVLRADAGTVYNVATSLKEGNRWFFEVGNYCYRYPHQIGLALYDRILQFISSDVYFVFIANLAFVIGINYVNYKIADYIFADKNTSMITVLISFAFLPQLFFILFAYGLIPGYFFMICAFYQAIKFAKEHQTKALVLTAVFAGVATLLKKNFLIGVIAISIYLVLSINKEKLTKTLVAVCCVVLATFLTSQLVIGCFELWSKQDLHNGTPSILWVTMGTDIDNEGRAPGWYDHSVYTTYTDTGYDSELSSQIGKSKLEDNIEKIKNEPGRAFTFFINKNISQWCEPTYQSIWSGPLEDCGQFTHTKLLKSIYTGQGGAKVVTIFNKFVTMLIWGFAAVFLIKHRKEKDGWQIAFMYFVGGLLFHTIWEGKSQYIYPYVFSLIPFAAFAFNKSSLQLADAIKKVKLKRNN